MRKTVSVYDWPSERRFIVQDLLRQTPFNRGTWQAMDVSQSKAHQTYELEDVSLLVHDIDPQDIPDAVGHLQRTLTPDLPWAEDHFQERVSGVPYNPPPSAARWPYAVRGNGDHTNAADMFQHTYPERLWPKHVNAYGFDVDDHAALRAGPTNWSNFGLRFALGDLGDVAKQLAENPLTRQAFVPIWFPEDTGAVEHQRVPCTLGYHFLVSREGLMSCRYYIRSVDVVRHLRNDVYMAARLLQWMAAQVNHYGALGVDLQNGVSWQPIVPDRLVMHIASLHGFVADRRKLELML